LLQETRQTLKGLSIPEEDVATEEDKSYVTTEHQKLSIGDIQNAGPNKHANLGRSGYNLTAPERLYEYGRCIVALDADRRKGKVIEVLPLGIEGGQIGQIV